MTRAGNRRCHSKPTDNVHGYLAAMRSRGTPVSIPPEFPKNITLPPGTVITASRRAGNAVVLEGFIPMELPKATRFFLQNLTAVGFRLGRGEAERDEAEDRFHRQWGDWLFQSAQHA